MIKSMTGFGKAQLNENGYEISCEIKGVNHRFLDFHCRLPRRYLALEERVKDEIKKYVARGRIEISINIDKTVDSSRTIKVDKGLAIAYYNSLKDLAEYLNISPDIKLLDVFRLPDVFTLEDEEEDLELVWNILQKTLQLALESLVDMRCREGQHLADDIRNRNQYILQMVQQLESRSPQVTKEYQDKLRARIEELLDQENLDETRLLQEVAIFADKASVTEEIVRLNSHVKQMDRLLDDGDSVGRKCDFLVQEMFREINTVASKANDIQMSRIVVDVKAELEKIREQLQNIE